MASITTNRTFPLEYIGLLYNLKRILLYRWTCLKLAKSELQGKYSRLDTNINAYFIL